ncbi:MAG: tRNA dihydrouridine synthase DusB [Phycisphaerales bacterium]|nr:tRNA dihydrouridine synthase DusB [Phycisphaerales bacterium]
MLAIGDVHLETNLLLAPIAGHCDLAFRLVCRSLGGLGLTCTELLHPRGLLDESAGSLVLARIDEREHPVAMQLYGCDPALLADGAKWAVDHGADLVDLNMGCPVEKVTGRNGGAALLRSPRLARRIVETVRAAVDVPVTVKMRLGWDAGSLVAPGFARDFEKTGIDAVIVHGRTAEQRFSGHVDLVGIRHVVEATERIPVIGNGDIKSADDAQHMIDATGCAGIMIGRAAIGRPWIFRELHAELTGTALEPLTVRDKLLAIRQHVENMTTLRGERRALAVIRQRISRYGASLGHVKTLKETIRCAPNIETVLASLDVMIDDPVNSQRTIVHPGM